MWIVWIIIAAAYVFSSGVVVARVRQELMRRDNNCDGRYRRGGACNDEFSHWLGAALAGMFWPISLLIVAGVLVAETPQRKPARLERQRTQELEQARHETALAEERALQAAALRNQEAHLGIVSGDLDLDDAIEASTEEPPSRRPYKRLSEFLRK